MATTDQVVFLKSLQKYEEGLNSLVHHYDKLVVHYDKLASAYEQDAKSKLSSEVAAHIYSLVRKDVTNIIKAYRLTMEV